MTDSERKQRLSKGLIEEQISYIQRQIVEASSPLERVKAISLYLKAIGLDILIALGLVYKAESDSDTQE